jgi:glycosyltransferase involved in cell wall biosynthesis
MAVRNSRRRKLTISLVLPTYNEEKNLSAVLAEIFDVLKFLQSSYNFELIVVDDGDDDLETLFLKLISDSNSFFRHDVNSRNQNKIRIIKSQSRRSDNLEHLSKFSKKKMDFISITYIKLSRRAGQANAVIAGIAESKGDFIITMDSDGQDDPRFILKMLNSIEKRANLDVVMVQRPSEKKSIAYYFGSMFFYRWFARDTGIALPPGGSDFRLISRKIADFILTSRDPEPFMRGLVLWPTKNVAVIRSLELNETGRRPRLSGVSKYGLGKSATLAVRGILTFSTFPLRAVTRLGLILSLVLPLVLVYTVATRLFTTEWVPGGALIIGLIVSLFGLNFVIQAIFAEYVQSVFKLVINRPRYIVERQWKRKMKLPS